MASALIDWDIHVHNIFNHKQYIYCKLFKMKK